MPRKYRKSETGLLVSRKQAGECPVSLTPLTDALQEYAPGVQRKTVITWAREALKVIGANGGKFELAESLMNKVLWSGDHLNALEAADTILRLVTPWERLLNAPLSSEMLDMMTAHLALADEVVPEVFPEDEHRGYCGQPVHSRDGKPCKLKPGHGGHCRTSGGGRKRHQ